MPAIVTQVVYRYAYRLHFSIVRAPHGADCLHCFRGQLLRIGDFGCIDDTYGDRPLLGKRFKKLQRLHCCLKIVDGDRVSSIGIGHDPEQQPEERENQLWQRKLVLLEYHGRNSAVPVDRSSCPTRVRASMVIFVGVSPSPYFFGELIGIASKAFATALSFLSHQLTLGSLPCTKLPTTQIIDMVTFALIGRLA